MNMFLALLMLTVSSNTVSGSDVVSVIRGRPVVLQCAADPGDTIISVIWKLHLYNSSCVVSYKIEEDNTTSYSSCSTRMRSHNLSLSISNTEVSDEGTYTCEVVNDNDTVFINTSLRVLAQPSTYLTVNNGGSPECGAIGGNPPAEISWIPHADDINTTVVEEPDRTWSVISTFSRKRMNGTKVTCVVSHPTLVNPWKEDIALNGYWSPVAVGSVISFLLISACLIIWKMPYLRALFKRMVNTDPQRTHNDREEDKQECEPYEIYTQRDNVIYSLATKVDGTTSYRT